MKNCLKCKKEFQEKRDSAKYCSTSCRVMYNRRNQKPPTVQNVVTEHQTQVLYNAVMEMVCKINNGIVPAILDYPRVKGLMKVEPAQNEEQEFKGKSTYQYLKEIADLETPYEFESKTIEIKNDPTLSEKDRKDLLLNIKLPKS